MPVVYITVRTNANDRFAFETGVERRCVKRVSESTQKGERADIGVCVTTESHTFGQRSAWKRNVPLPEFSLAIFEEMASRMALQQSSASGA